MKKIILTAFAIFFLFPLFSYLFPSVHASNHETLLKSIEDKSKALAEINSQIQTTQKQILETEQKGKSLKQEVKRADYRISQLSLSIKSSEIKIEKLNLEIDSLEYGIGEKTRSIEAKKTAITNFLRELSSKDHESVLLALLKNKSLADGLFEAQSIENISNGLDREIISLEEIKNELQGTLEETAERKESVEKENQTLRQKKTIVEGEKKDRGELLRTTKNQEKLYQEQLKALEKQQDEIAKEIEETERELRTKIDINLLPIPRPGVLAWPVKGGVMSQGYGATTFARYNYRGKHHNGVDIAAPIGTEIYAAEDGEVTATGDQDKFCRKAAYGKFIVVRHDNGLTTLYGHLSGIAVVPGQKVSRGALIGYMGKTGWATGSHVHFTVWSTVTHLMRPTRVCGLMPVGGDIDPTQYLERTPTNNG